MFRWLELKMFRTARVEATGTASALLLIPPDHYGLALLFELLGFFAAL